MTLSTKRDMERMYEDIKRCAECGTEVDPTSAYPVYVEGLWFCDKHCKEFYFEE